MKRVLLLWTPAAIVVGIIFVASSLPGQSLPSVSIWSFDKVVHAAAIPNAGGMVTPQKPEGSAGGAVWGDYSPGEAWARGLSSRPGSPQLDLERSRIPLFLGSQRWGEMAAILDYERWDDVQYGQASAPPELVRMHARQDYPLNYPFARAFYAADEVRLDSAGGDASVYVTRDQHYPLYLEVP